jgi:hypothetical protein
LLLVFGIGMGKMGVVKVHLDGRVYDMRCLVEDGTGDGAFKDGRVYDTAWGLGAVQLVVNMSLVT